MYSINHMFSPTQFRDCRATPGLPWDITAWFPYDLIPWTSINCDFCLVVYSKKLSTFINGLLLLAEIWKPDWARWAAINFRKRTQNTSHLWQSLSPEWVWFFRTNYSLHCTVHETYAMKAPQNQWFVDCANIFMCESQTKWQETKLVYHKLML